MKIWSWYGAGEGYAAMLPVRKEDIFNGTFSAEGGPKQWAKRPQVKPGVERDKKKQKPVADLSPLMGASIIMNAKAHATLKDFLEQFGQFLELDLVDETGLAGGDQPLFFYNVTNVVAAVDLAKSKKDEGGIAVPKFVRDAVPKAAQVFKDPLMLKSRIFLNDAAHDELKKLLEQAGLKGSSFVAA